MNIPYVMKKCSKCGKWKVASTVNFHRDKYGKYALTSQCKECRNKQKKQWYQDNREKEHERHKQYYEANRGKILEHRKQYYETNKDKEAEYKKQYYEANRDKRLEYSKQYNKVNRDKRLEYRKQYYEANREKIAEYYKQYREANPEYYKQWNEANRDKISEYCKRYHQSLKGQVSSFNGCQRRRIKEEQQGTGITKEQWLEMMSFFDWKCAYSGETLSKNNRSVDHIVPLNSNGDNMIWNMVPMLRSLNSSKNTKDMLEWYKQQSFFSEARLAKIYEWQEYAYNKYGKDTEYFNTNDIQITLL